MRSDLLRFMRSHKHPDGDCDEVLQRMEPCAGALISTGLMQPEIA